MSPSDDSLFSETELDAAEATLSVRELSLSLSRMLKAEFPREVWVRGQIRNLSRSARGHVYFTLVEPVDPGASPDHAVSVVLFDSAKQIVNRVLSRSGAGRMEDGVEIRIRAAVEFYSPQGSLQLRMTAVDPEYTLGRLAADRDRILRVLSGEGLLTANASCPLPFVPQRIVLITSAGSAAAADFHHELERSGFRFTIQVLDTRVQGDAAAESLTHAVLLASTMDADVIALIRGGGSRTDLASFDNEGLARAIAACPIAVIAGIGHEIDRSIADEVAHTSLKTPTACANMLVETMRDADQRFALLGQRIAAVAQTWPAHHERAVQTLALRLVAASEAATRSAMINTARCAREVQLQTMRQHHGATTRLDGVAARVQPAVRGALRHAEAHTERQRLRLRSSAPRPLRSQARDLENWSARVRALDPVQTLRRGFSITTDSDGRLVRSVLNAPPTLITRVADGRIVSTVTTTEPTPPAEPSKDDHE